MSERTPSQMSFDEFLDFNSERVARFPKWKRDAFLIQRVEPETSIEEMSPQEGGVAAKDVPDRE